MKRLLLLSLLSLPILAEDPDAKAGGYELTLGGGGTALGEDQWQGLDIGLSANPFKTLPSLWLGVNQGLAWEPAFGGSTDINANWSWHLVGDLYLNTGWSVGAAYYSGECFTVDWRTGPEVTAQYYFGNAFIYAGVNYDLSLEGEEDGIRYSLGIGIAF